MSGSRSFRRSLRASAPQFLQPLIVQDVDGILTLECHVDGCPKPDIRWEKSGKPIGKSRRVHMVRSGEKCLLQIRLLQEEDDGLYSCTATNNVGTASTYFRVAATAQPCSRKNNVVSIYIPKSTRQEVKSIVISRESIENRNNSRNKNPSPRSRSTSRSRQDIFNNNCPQPMLSNLTGGFWKKNDGSNPNKLVPTSCKKTSGSIHDSRESVNDKSPPKSSGLSRSRSTARQETANTFTKSNLSSITSRIWQRSNGRNVDAVSKSSKELSKNTLSSRESVEDVKNQINSVRARSRSTSCTRHEDSKASAKSNTSINGDVRKKPDGDRTSHSTAVKFKGPEKGKEDSFESIDSKKQNSSIYSQSEKETTFIPKDSISDQKCFSSDINLTESQSPNTEISKSGERGKNTKKGLFNKVKIPEIFVQKQTSQGLDPQNDHKVNDHTRNEDASIQKQLPTPENVPRKNKSKISEYLKRFESPDTHVELSNDCSSFKETANANPEERRNSETKDSNRFFSLGRLLWRKNSGNVKGSPSDGSTFVSHISFDIQSNKEPQKVDDMTVIITEKDVPVASVKSSVPEIIQESKSESTVPESDSKCLVLESESDSCGNNLTSGEFYHTANTEVPNSGLPEVSEKCPDEIHAEENLPEPKKEDTIITIPDAPTCDIICGLRESEPPPEIGPRNIPSIYVDEVSEEVRDDAGELEFETAYVEEPPKNSRTSPEPIVTREAREGRIRYSSSLIEEECQNFLGPGTQAESVEADPQRVSSPVESPARIVKGPQSVTVLRGESVTLAISFTGNPVPNVLWMKGGRILRNSGDDDNGRLSILEGGAMSVVSVNDVTADDSGKYVVCVENEGGGDSRFASVAVVGFPEPPGGEPTASEVTDHSITLSWYGSMYDGGSVVTGYQVEMCTLPDKKWYKVTSSVNTSSSVQGLSMGQRYIFRVRAENRYGLSHPSKESKIICLNDFLQYDTSSDEEPEDAPENPVTIENGSCFTERFDLKEEVGKGKFGTVFRCVELSCGRPRAAKVIRCLKIKDKEKVRQEIEVMSRLQHPKLMQVLAAFESGRNMIMIMEFISGGELFERVIADDFILTEHDCILFMKQICDGVAYMHKSGVIHLDLKPENILCKTRTSHKIKIIDFGLARFYKSDEPLRILFGTPEFVAPEVISYEPVSPASDMWSVGVICYVLLSGLSPFMGDNDTETFANITRGETDFDDEAFDEISQDAKDFISNLLVKRTKARLSAEECLKHPWLATVRLVPKRPLSTEKLKRFIIRRKWQKSGTAIRALGRMVSLSRSSLGSSIDSYSPIGSPTSSRSRCSLTSRSETADSGDSVFSR